MGPIHHILVPTDFGESSERAVEFAVDLAMKFDARLTMLHVWSVPVIAAPEASFAALDLITPLQAAARAQLDEAVARVKARVPSARGELRLGGTWDEILEVSDQVGADLIVMGTHGRGAVAHALLGSVAERVVRLSSIPVLTVRGEHAALRQPSTTTPFRPNELARLLNSAIEICVDGENGYGAAALDAQSPELEDLFSRYMEERAGFVAALQGAVDELGIEHANRGTARAALHRRWTGLRLAVEGPNDDAVIEECLRGDAAAEHAYERLLVDAVRMPKHIAALLRAQHDGIGTAIGRITASKKRPRARSAEPGAAPRPR